MIRINFFILFLLLLLATKAFSDDKDLILNLQMLTNKIKSEGGLLNRKELLLQIKQPKLSVILDLKAGQKDDYLKIVPTTPEETPLYHFLDVVLKGSDLFYHTDNDSLIIGSEWFWLIKEESYQKEYDISGLYDQKEDLKVLLQLILAPFDIVKCKYEINFINSKQCAINGNKYIHFYLKSFFLNIRKPIFDFSQTSSQIIFPAEEYFKEKPLNALPATLSAQEWLVLISQLNSEMIQFNNELIKKNLVSNSIKVEKENETIVFLLNQIKTQTNASVYYQKGRGLFFNQDDMQKLVPIQRVQTRIYNIKQFVDKLNGAFICQNIKDEVKKDIWVFPENQVTYYKHLEAIIVIAPPQYFPDIDNLFFKLKQSSK